MAEIVAVERCAAPVWGGRFACTLFIGHGGGHEHREAPVIRQRPCDTGDCGWCVSCAEAAAEDQSIRDEEDVDGSPCEGPCIHCGAAEDEWCLSDDCPCAVYGWDKTDD